MLPVQGNGTLLVRLSLVVSLFVLLVFSETGTTITTIATAAVVVAAAVAAGYFLLPVAALLI